MSSYTPSPARARFAPVKFVGRVVSFVLLIVLWSLEPGYAGLLLQPDGTPATNVTVYLLDDRATLTVGQNLRVQEGTEVKGQKIVTDSFGRFSISSERLPLTLAVIDPAGYCEERITVADSLLKLRLRRWGSLEGRLFIGSKPAAGERIGVRSAPLHYVTYPRDFSAVWLRMETTTDSAGRFTFPTLPPVSLEAYHNIPIVDAPDGLRPSQTTRVDISEGKTQQTILGGKGRPVLGKIQLNDFAPRFDWRQDSQALRANVPRPAVLQQLDETVRAAKAQSDAAPSQREKDQSKQAAELQESEIREKARTFYASTAGREYNFNQIYALNFSQDGFFRVEDVPSGIFTLEIVLRERGGLPGVPSSQLARVVQSIEVPGTNNAAPLDLGTISVTPQRPALRNGETAPDFEVNDLTGTPFKLSNFKGKYVLLEFWAVWCPPCIDEIPHLKETYEAFNKDERFVMISLSLDENPQIPRKFIEEHSIAWKQGFLGEWPPGPIAKSYHVPGPPYIYLIGPDGKIVANRLRGSNIKQAVQAALQSR